MKFTDTIYQILFCIFAVTQICFAAEAATITVTSNLDDDGNGCTLREAIAGVNQPTSSAVQNNGCVLGDGNNDTINFSIALPSTITLTQDTVIAITKPVTINGPGVNKLSIDGNFSSGFLFILADDVVLSRFTVRNVRMGGPGGTAITISDTENVKVLNCRFANNVTSNGALRIFESTGITVSNSEFANNFAGSGPGAILVISTDGVIEDSTFVDNSSDSSGGAISLRDSTDFVIKQSFFSGNQASRRGGAISVFDNSLPFPPGSPGALVRTKIINSTFTENSISTSSSSSNLFNNGDAIHLRFETNGIELINNTIVNNGDQSNGASSIVVTNPDNSDFSLVLYNNIISGNRAIAGVPAAFNFSDPDLSSIQSSGNIIGDASRSSGSELNGSIPGNNIWASSNRRNIPLSRIIGSLGNNGGPTHTFSLAQNSIAVNSGVRDICPALDQRSIVRVNTEEDACDVGAFEDTVQGPIIGVRNEDSFFVIPTRNGGTVIFNL